MHFVEWKCFNSDQDFTEVYSEESNLKNAIIASDDGLAPNRLEAIIWTNAGVFYLRIYASLGLSELNRYVLSASVT